jgi:AraC-like DNA-binding protein
MTYLTRSASLTNYIEVSRSTGINPYVQLSNAGIDRSVLLDLDTRIPVQALAQLLEASAQAAQVDDFGLRMAETRQFSNLGPLSFVARENATLRKTLESMSHYLRLQNEALTMRIEEREGICIIRQEVLGRYVGTLRQSMQLTVGVMYRMLSVFLGDAWKPRSVCFVQSAPANREVFTRMFGAAVLFNQDFDGIVCRASDLDAAIASYDPIMAEQTRKYLDTMLAHADSNMVDKVRRLVLALLPSGHCSLERVAQHLGVEARTVQRHLAELDESYSSILGAVREDLVLRYVTSGNRPLSAVSMLLGFSSLSAFSRWFGDRFGCSVSQWRKKTAVTRGELRAVRHRSRG